jgi:hypothetical protein
MLLRSIRTTEREMVTMERTVPRGRTFLLSLTPTGERHKPIEDPVLTDLRWERSERLLVWQQETADLPLDDSMAARPWRGIPRLGAVV